MIYFETIGILSMKKCVEFSINDSEAIWEDHCCFPLFKNYFFAHMISWNSWYSIPRIGKIKIARKSSHGMNVNSDAKVTKDKK
jgi:hypothetical protein